MEYHITADTTIGELMHEDSSEEFVLTADTTLDELAHHGIKGQKWGVRRYQNRDGSLTAAGKKRRDRLEVELEKLGGKKDGEGTSESRSIPLTRRQKKELEKLKKQRAENLEKARQAKIEKQKAAEKRAEDLEKGTLPLSKMTDAEIQAKIDRINLENRLKDLMKEPAKEAAPQKVNRGKVFGDKFKDDVVDKLAKNVAADLVAQTIKSVGVYGINKALNATLNKDGESSKEYVFTNNKRKDK